MISNFSSTDRFLYTRYIVLSYLFSISQQHLRKDHKTPQAIANVIELGQLVQGQHQQQQQQPNLKLEEQWPRGGVSVDHHDQPPPDEVIASAGLQDQPPPSVGPPNIAYRIDGEVLQLTRVPQDEAMRLVNSGATVIHVASDADDHDPLSIGQHHQSSAAGAGPSSGARMTAATTTASHLQQPQPTFHQRSSSINNRGHQHHHNHGLNSYDLPAELVQVLVAPEEATVAATTAASGGVPAVSAVTAGRPRNSGSGAGTSSQQQPQIEATPPPTSQHQDWINAYRR